MRRDRTPGLKRTFSGKYLITPNDEGGVAFFDRVNFAQESPHTDLFIISPDVAQVVFKECNLINVTTPEGAIIDGGNPAQIIYAETGNPDMPTVPLLSTEDRDISALVVLNERRGNQALPTGGRGRVQHHLLKGEFRSRRPVKDSERAMIESINADLLAKARAFKVQDG